MTSTLRQNYILVPPTSVWELNSGTWIAQTFTPDETHTIDRVDLLLSRKIGNNPGAVTVSIRATAVGEPDGADLCSGTAASSGLGEGAANASWLAFSMTVPVELTAGTKYAICTRTATADILEWSYDAFGTYAGGNVSRSTNIGVTWGAIAAHDAAFKEYGLFDASGVTPTDLQHGKKLVAVGNNEVWYESASGTMAELAAANGDIDCSLPLNVFEAYGKIFVVNHTNLKVADFQNVKITTANLGANPPDPGTVLTQSTGTNAGASMVVDYITTLTGACTIYGQSITTLAFESAETVTGTDDGGNAISFTTNSAEADGPHWYDWTVYGGSATYGAMPAAATIGCRYHGRAVIAGNSRLPHQWYMSRQARPHDFLYGINDAQSAVAGNNADAGEIGDIPTALIPYKDDWLIVGCANTCWIFTGDPTNGGSLDELDLTTGIFGAQSWCWGKEGELYFWGLNGIYKVQLPGGTPVCVSEIRLPKLIEDEAATPDTHRITLTYDKKRAGIKVDITLLADGSNSCYWYDFRTDGFFPENYPDSCGTYSSIEYDSTDPDYNDVIYGCSDGYLRSLDPASKDDDVTTGTQAIDSYVTFGPFLMSDFANNEGKITGLDIILGGGGAAGSQSDSDGATYELYTARSAEKVLELMSAGTAMRAAGTITGPGRDRKTFRKKIRGVYGGIKLKNATASQTWALEQLLIDVKKAGGLR